MLGAPYDLRVGGAGGGRRARTAPIPKLKVRWKERRMWTRMLRVVAERRRVHVRRERWA